MKTRYSFLPSVATAAYLACAGAPEPAATHIVQAGSSTPTYTLENSGVLEIGSAAVDDLDRLYVSGAATGRMHVYGPGGRHSTGPARVGLGPGELSSIEDMTVLDGELWVRNDGRPVYERFDTAGGFLGSVLFPLTTSDGQRARVIGARRDGRFWSLRPSATPDGLAQHAELVVIDSAGSAGPALASVAIGPSAPGGGAEETGTAALSDYYAIENGLAAVVVTAQASPPDPAREAGEGPTSATSAHIVVQLFGEEDDPIRTIVHEGAWQPFSERERRLYSSPERVLADAEDLEDRPARRGLSAPVPGLMLGRDSSVWLRGRPVDPDSVQWLAWRPKSVDPIRVHLPAADVLLAANRAWIWTSRRVAHGSPIAARMRLVPVDSTSGAD